MPAKNTPVFWSNAYLKTQVCTQLTLLEETHPIHLL